MSHVVLWCLVERDSTPFDVTVPVNASIGRLKKLIHENGINDTERSILAKDLVLWKVSTS